MKKETKKTISRISLIVAFTALAVLLIMIATDKIADNFYIAPICAIVFALGGILHAVFSGNRFFISGIPFQIRIPDKEDESEQRVCPTCGQPSEANAAFCSHCGTKMTVACPNCGRMLDSGAAFCKHCGTKTQ